MSVKRRSDTRDLLGTKSSVDTKTTTHTTNDDNEEWKEFIPQNSSLSLGAKSFDNSGSLTNYLPHYKSGIKEKYILGAFLSRVIVCILEECVNKLAFLAFKNKKNVEFPEEDQTVYRSVGERYGMLNDEQLLKYKIGLETSDISQLQKQIVLLIGILETAYEELDTTGTFNRALNKIDNLLSMQREDEIFKQTVKSKLKTLDDVKHLYKEQIKKAGQCKNELSSKFAANTLECENYIFNKNGEKNFVDDWEAARIEQQNIIKNSQKDVYIHTKNNVAQRTILEDAAHVCIERFYLISEEDMSVDINTWSTLYDKKMEEMDMKINKIKVDIENFEIEYEENLVIYKQRQSEINAWLASKREMKRKADLEKRRNMLATKIQAWWKGIMVRLRLGAFGQFFKILDKELKARRKAEKLAAKLAEQ